MKTIRIKNKTLNYTEELSDNIYSVKLAYIKPATANTDRQPMSWEIDVFITGAVDGYTELPELSVRAYLNGKHIMVNGSINRYDRSNLNLYVSSYEYSSKYNASLTEADAYLMSEFIKTITTDSAIISTDIIKNLSNKKAGVNALLKAIDELETAKQNLEEAQRGYSKTLEILNLSQVEAEMTVQLLNEGADQVTVISAVKRLLA